jgi:hypothetical protein
VFLREGCAGYVTLCRVLVVVPITSFLPVVRRLEFPLFIGGSGALLQSQWEHWVSVHCEGQASSHQQSSGLPLLDRGDVTLLQEHAV